MAAWADLKAPGTYVVEVRDGSSNARSAEPYNLTLDLVRTADVAEPNDTRETATALAWNREVSANILPKGDVDHYSVRLDAQGEIRVTFGNAPPELNMAFRVLDEQGRQVWGWQTASAAGAPFAGWADVAGSGLYVIEVRDGSNNARSSQPYSISAALRTTADPAEPNNDSGAATALSLDDTLEANILPKGDADHYRVILPRPGRLTVAFQESPAELNMAFRLLDEAGRQVSGWQTAPEVGKPFEGWTDVAAAGTYVLEVRDGSNNARSADPYSLRATFQ